MASLWVALDLPSARRALHIAERLQGVVDVIEAGSPLLHAAGLKIIRDLRKALKGVPIAADLKISTLGSLETELAVKAGVNWVSVSSAVSAKTITEVVTLAMRAGRHVAAEMAEEADPALVTARAWQLEELGVDLLLYRLPDWQSPGRSPLAGLQVLQESHLHIPWGIVGGIKLDDLPVLLAYAPSVIVVGRAIVRSPSGPRRAALQFQQAISSQEGSKDCQGGSRPA